MVTLKAAVEAAKAYRRLGTRRTWLIAALTRLSSGPMLFWEPVGLPEPKLGTCYIVSQLVKNALPERDNLVVPAKVVRNAAGNIIGCKSLGNRRNGR